MHEIEPFFNWRPYYVAARDKLSPFYGRQYDVFQYSQSIYNFYLHPQWDSFGSTTLYCKILYVNYETNVAVIELIGEWNDAIENDIMSLKRELIDSLMEEEITKFILIGENVLNFHPSDDCYYEEWYEDVKDEGGWITAVNFRQHIVDEMRSMGIHYFLNMGNVYNDVLWRKLKPEMFCELVESMILKEIE